MSKAGPFITVTAVFLVLHLSSCSMSSMTYLPENYHPRQTPHCSGYIYPILDAIFAPMVIMVPYSMISFSSDEERQKGIEPNPVQLGTVVGFSLLTILILGSGINGFLEANRCRRAHDSHEAWLEMREEEEQGQDTK